MGAGGPGPGGPTIFLYINSEYIFAKSWSSCTKIYCTQKVKMYEDLEIFRTCVLDANYAISSYLIIEGDFSKIYFSSEDLSQISG